MKHASMTDHVVPLMVATLLALGSPGSSLFAAAPGTNAGTDPYAIRLQSRQFTPNPLVSKALSATRSERPWHALIQFEQPLDATRIAALRAQGIKVRNYISGHTIAATVPARIDPASVEGVRWSGRLTGRDKVLGAPQRDLMVEFFPDTPSAQIQRLVEQAGGQRLPTPSLPRFVARVILPAGQEAPAALAEATEVSSVAATPAALQEGRDVHYCPGPMTEAGPVAHFVLRGDGWDGPGAGSISLTYYFGTPTSDLSVSAQRGEITRALNTWSRYAAIAWSETATPRRSRSFDIHFASGDHGDGSPFDGPSAVLAHCFFPSPPNSEPIAGDMHFDEAEQWRIGANFDLFTVALHEAGHGLGLGHSADSTAVMAPYYAGVVSGLASDDIAGIRALYASVGNPSNPGNPSVANDTFANAISISGTAGSVTGANLNATSEPGEPAHAGFPARRSIWYRWTAPAAGSYTFRTSGSSYDTVLAAYTGSSITALQPIAANDDASDTTSLIQFNAIAGTTYRLAVDGYDGASGNVSLRWDGQTAPVITGHPSSQTVFVNGSATFTVAATGSSLSYQWLRDGSMIPGATQSSFSIGSVRLTDAATYSVRVSNPQGAVHSSGAVLTVLIPDLTMPRISLLTPSAGARLTSASVSVTGRASDDQRLARIDVRLNGGSWQTAQGSEYWNLTVPATPGANAIEVRAVDGAGNTSPILRREFTYVWTVPLRVRLDGHGKVTPDLDGRPLEVGRRYTVRATPDSGWLFSHWSGPGFSGGSTLTFVMAENLSVAVHFVRNPFPEVAGRYHGLFFDTNTVDQAGSGYLAARINPLGAFSATLRWLGQRIPISGRFQLDGRCTNVVIRPDGTIIRTELSVAFRNEARLTGIVTLGTRRAFLQADRAGHAGRASQRFSGIYEMILPSEANAPDQPGTLGQLRITVNEHGTARIIGIMADRGVVTHTTAISTDGDLPLYAEVRSGGTLNTLLGWLRITPHRSPAVTGLVSWMNDGAPIAGFLDNPTPAPDWHYQSQGIGVRLEGNPEQPFPADSIPQ